MPLFQIKQCTTVGVGRVCGYGYSTVTIDCDGRMPHVTSKPYTVGSRFATVLLRRFTFTTPVESDRALPNCGASLLQLIGSRFATVRFTTIHFYLRPLSSRTAISLKAFLLINSFYNSKEYFNYKRYSIEN